MEHFNQIVRILLKYYRLLLILPLIAMLSLWYLTKDQPKKYEVKSKFLFDFDGKSTSVSGEVLNQQQIYTEILNTLELIKSKKLAEKIKTRIAYESLTGTSDVFPFEWPEANRKELEKLLSNVLTGAQSPFLAESPLSETLRAFYNYHQISSEGLINAISARRLHSSNYLEISIVYADASQVFYISNLLNELLVFELESINKKNIGKQKAIIEELVRKAKRELDQKVKELEELKVNNNIINLGEHTKAIVTYQVQLEQVKSNLSQQIAAASQAEKTIKSGIDGQHFAGVNKEINESLISTKNELLNAQEIKLGHLKKVMDYDELIGQQRAIYEHNRQIKQKLAAISNQALYDPTMVQTDLTMQYIDYGVKVNQLTDELKVVDKEIDRVKQYAAYFAPFESAISTLRDEIYTAQNTYLLFLNKLNMTESLEVSANRSKLELIDYPEYPLKSLPSKVKLMIVAGGLSVFVLLTAFIIVNYLLDNRIKDVETFQRRMNERVVTALPQVPENSSDEHLLTALNLICQEGLKKITREIDQSRSVAICAPTGKDNAAALAAALQAYWENEKVVVLQFDHQEENVEAAIHQALTLNDRVISLCNPLQFSDDGILIAQNSDVAFLHFTCGRIKSSADARVMKSFEDRVPNYAGFILSGLLPEYMDSYYGELPKRRSRVRMLFKKLLNRDFSWK